MRIAANARSSLFMRTRMVTTCWRCEIVWNLEGKLQLEMLQSLRAFRSEKSRHGCFRMKLSSLR